MTKINKDKANIAQILLATVCIAAIFFGGCKTTEKQVVAEEPGQTVFCEIEMIWIPAGTFLMGSPEDEPGREYNETQHEVTLTKGFYLGKYPVTQEQYQAVMGVNPSFFKGPNLPVENVSWRGAIVFCNRLSMKEGLSPAYRIKGSTDPGDWEAAAKKEDYKIWDTIEIVPGSSGYRLPTEAQWEYACRAGAGTAFNAGDNITTDQANYKGNYPKDNNTADEYRMITTPVGSFTPNAWGLYDMHGNVWELCWDWYKNYPGGAQVDPAGAASGPYYRVMRGGSWDVYGQQLRSAFRGAAYPDTFCSELSFRLLRP